MLQGEVFKIAVCPWAHKILKAKPSTFALRKPKGLPQANCEVRQKDRRGVGVFGLSNYWVVLFWMMGFVILNGVKNLVDLSVIIWLDSSLRSE